MKATTTPGILPAAVLGLPIQSARENSKGVMLYPVTPQPSCRLVYACMGDCCGKWVYPTASTWQKWGDEDYKRPDDMFPYELNEIWAAPYHTGDIVPVQKPWEFVQSSDCDDCETSQTTYLDKFGCVEFSASQNQLCAQFQPTHLMPQKKTRLFILITRMEMMRLHKVPAFQFHKEGLICPDGHPFPKDLRLT